MTTAQLERQLETLRKASEVSVTAPEIVGLRERVHQYVSESIRALAVKAAPIVEAFADEAALDERVNQYARLLSEKLAHSVGRKNGIEGDEYEKYQPERGISCVIADVKGRKKRELVYLQGFVGQGFNADISRTSGDDSTRVISLGYACETTKRKSINPFSELVRHRTAASFDTQRGIIMPSYGIITSLINASGWNYFGESVDEVISHKYHSDASSFLIPFGRGEFFEDGRPLKADDFVGELMYELLTGGSGAKYTNRVTEYGQEHALQRTLSMLQRTHEILDQKLTVLKKMGATGITDFDGRISYMRESQI
ncbi:hypothetical protein KY343_01785 [Candidatus Woesearchaeota archaeon]|nr:hypothetical protein [Candidatus Woesearchaeota archaeon]